MMRLLAVVLVVVALLAGMFLASSSDSSLTLVTETPSAGFYVPSGGQSQAQDQQPQAQTGGQYNPPGGIPYIPLPPPSTLVPSVTPGAPPFPPTATLRVVTTPECPPGTVYTGTYPPCLVPTGRP
ncbi:MAG: hypothetical protein SF029_26030 [bacterium]|nr:hypothetical protein [bacterium]